MRSETIPFELKKISDFSGFSNRQAKPIGKGKSARGLIRIIAEPECEGGGFSLVWGIRASKKGCHKHAVARNRARRRLKSAFLKMLPLFQWDQLKGRVEFLITARTYTITAPWPEICQDLKECLRGIQEQYEAASK